MNRSAIKSFRDSTADLGNPSTLRKRLREDGYLFLRGVISGQALDRAREDVIRVVGAAGWLRQGLPAAERVADRSQTCVEPQPEFRRVYDQVYSLESFHALPHEPPLMKLLGELLEVPEPLVHPRKIGRLIFPVTPGQPDFSTPAHQDYWALQGSPDTITAWIPLHDCPFEHGTLMAAHATHQDGIFDYRLALGAGAVEVSAPLDGRWHSADFEAGDVVLFWTLTVHKASGNLTDKLRLSIDCRYQRPQDPITEPCIDLKGVGLDWDLIYRSWSRPALKYYWRKWHLKTEPYSSKFYDRRDELAFEEGEKGNLLAVSSLQRLAQYHPDESVKSRAQQLLRNLTANRL